jgi:hypothetical protein
MTTKIGPTNNSEPHTLFIEHFVGVTEKPPQEYKKESEELEPLMWQIKKDPPTSTSKNSQQTGKYKIDKRLCLC